jgi:hypothetical protein
LADIVTLDESWFCFVTDYETIWLPRQRRTGQNKEMTVTIVWNSTSFHQISVLPKGAEFNSDYYISEIFAPLVEWRSGQAGATNRKLIVHADNARVHTPYKATEFFDAKRLKMGPHPLYSPDLALGHFDVFGYIKG